MEEKQGRKRKWTNKEEKFKEMDKDRKREKKEQQERK